MERSIHDIAAEVIHYIGEDGSLNIENKEQGQDLLLMILLEQIYPADGQITLAMPN